MGYDKKKDAGKRLNAERQQRLDELELTPEQRAFIESMMEDEESTDDEPSQQGDDDQP
ncbi:hypothetical protein [Enterobacter hormaechei]|jgi:Spy/CpxP family protein refolding chaperone|uniref:hypothetical protein n=1 Tax=Enterobacter hormaechei TaxID=158836 RepID=UPI00254D16E4|nr:hypothetical protein [Enterobacter hormaechei]MDK9635643.1 hypothetical protein [Enterobacter hormaechei]